MAIYATDYLIAKHEELLPVFERLGKRDYLEREQKRLEYLYKLRREQRGAQPIQLSLF